MALTKPSVMNIWANAISGSLGALFSVPTIIDSGWPAPSGTPVKPLIGDFNWLFNYVINGVRYLCARGVSDWDATETQYTAGAIVRETTNGRYYVLDGTATTGLSPASDPTNWIMWLRSPIARALSWTEEVFSWRNARLQRRFGIDHHGFPNGQIQQWDENWDGLIFSDSFHSFLAPTFTSAGTGSVITYGQKWDWLADNGGVVQTMPPTSTSLYRMLRMTFPTTGGGRVQCGRNLFACNTVVTDFLALTMDWMGEFIGGPTGNTFVMGFRCDSQNINTINDGIFFIKGVTDTTWQCRTIVGGLSQNADSGVPAATGTQLRFRIVVLGSGTSDSATRHVRFTINGSDTVISTRIPASSGTDLVMGPIFGGFSDPAADPVDMFITPVRYRQNLIPGDVFL